MVGWCLFTVFRVYRGILVNWLVTFFKVTVRKMASRGSLCDGEEVGECSASIIPGDEAVSQSRGAGTGISLSPP